ncbi:MAG: P27 family phage terminase small subunit, partial [Clostridiales bacterium]|nr:P27 family phage terminase small subunit [Clostridiales bacterium]
CTGSWAGSCVLATGVLCCKLGEYSTFENGIFCGFRFLLPKKEVNMGTEQTRIKSLKTYQEEQEDSNKLLHPPRDLTEKERAIWEEISSLIISSTHYKKTTADVELVRQYCQTKIMRDRAWSEYNKNPERYIRIVTGICSDGMTPKVLVKENEHYKTWIECNKLLEKLLKDFRLTPEARRR